MSSAQSGESNPAAFGIISRAWSPRLEFAGTFDQGWLETQWPLPPRDFDPKHYQAAPFDQQSVTLKGGEPVHLVNLTPEGTWSFSLPKVLIPIRLIFDDRVREAVPRMDTIMIEPDLRSVSIVLRLKIASERNRPRLREVLLGQVMPGLLRAKTKNKVYVDLRSLHNQTSDSSDLGQKI